MTLRVLAVDDSRTIREMLKLTLCEAGFETELAEDGIHALEILENTRPDVIVTDINMPRLGGLELISRIRSDSAFRKIPIIVLTTESTPDMKQRARGAGATGWIVKPFDPPKLIRALELVSGQ